MGVDNFAPVAFGFKNGKYEVRLGLKEVADIERVCAAGLPSVINQMEAGFLSAIIQVASRCAYRETEVGFVLVEMSDLGPILNDPDKGFVTAFAKAVTQLGNVFGLAEPSKKASKSGSKSV